MDQLDLSHKDRKYFIDGSVYNCPFCNRRNVKYAIVDRFHFLWKRDKRCYGYIRALGNPALEGGAEA